MMSPSLMLFILLVIGFLVVIRVVKRLLLNRQTDPRTCRRCGMAHPSQAHFCRRCGQELV